MGDLEDSIFKHNVLGKYSTWDRGEGLREHCESDEEKSVDDDVEPLGYDSKRDMELFEQARALAQADIPESVRNTILADRERQSQTGVKGVLADYRAATALAHEQRIADANHRAAIITRMVEGHKVKNVVVSSDMNNALEDALNSDLDDDDDDEDDAFMKEFRQRRLRELQSASTLPVFGRVRDITSADFVSEVEEVDKRVFVIVHLFEASVQSCIRLNRFLEEVAVGMPNIKFLRMQASSNEIVVDLVTLPILTIYRGGESLHVAAGIAHEFGDFFTKEDVEWVISSGLQDIK